MAHSRPYFGSDHPLVEAVRRFASEHGCKTQSYGSTGCQKCWERAIRADERIVVECELGEPSRDANHVDDIAVEIALKGRTVRLTPAERRVLVRRLSNDGFSVHQIAHRFNFNASAIRRDVA